MIELFSPRGVEKGFVVTVLIIVHHLVATLSFLFPAVARDCGQNNIMATQKMHEAKRQRSPTRPAKIEHNFVIIFGQGESKHTDGP